MRATLILLILLAGCGVDGAPSAPEREDPKKPGPSITLSGQVKTGISRRLD